MEEQKDDRLIIDLPADPTSEQLAEAFRKIVTHAFQRHSVCIYVEFWLDKAKKDLAQVAIRAFSGVLVTVNDQWLAVTAGHCISEVERTIANGYEFKRCYLFDSETSTRGAVPLNWELCSPWYEFDEKSGADYGALFLPGNSRALLEAEGKQAMEIGALEPDETMWFGIYGYPDFAADNTEAKTNMTTYTFRVKRVAQPEDLPSSPTVETFFGEKVGSAPPSFVGLSGAPLFACTTDFPWSDESQYYLYAIQAWQRGREIGAPLVRGFLPLLKAEIERRTGGKSEKRES